MKELEADSRKREIAPVLASFLLALEELCKAHKVVNLWGNNWGVNTEFEGTGDLLQFGYSPKNGLEFEVVEREEG